MAIHKILIAILIVVISITYIKGECKNGYEENGYCTCNSGYEGKNCEYKSKGTLCREKFKTYINVGYQRSRFNAIIYNGSIYMHGGLSVDSTKIGVYDIKTNTYNDYETSLHRGDYASVLYNHHIYIHGGYDGSSAWHNNTFKMDLRGPLTSWTYLVDGPVRSGHKAVMNGTYMYFYGGSVGFSGRNEYWRLNLNSSTPVYENMTQEGYITLGNHCGTFRKDKFYIFGGISIPGDLNDLRVIGNDLQMTIITTRGKKPAPRHFASCVEWKDRWYIGHGTTVGATVTFNDLFRYDFELNHFSDISTNYTSQRVTMGASMVAYDHTLYIIKGEVIYNGARYSDLVMIDLEDCSCKVGYTGEFCDNTDCSKMINTCGNYGKCDTKDHCECDDDYNIHPTCSYRTQSTHCNYNWTSSYIVTTTSSPTERYGTANIFFGNYGYMYGGRKLSPIGELHQYDVFKSNWTVLSTTVPPRDLTSIIQFNDTLIIYGGRAPSITFTKKVIFFSLTSLSFRVINVPKKRRAHLAFNFNDEYMYIFDGESDTGVNKDVDRMHLYSEYWDFDLAKNAVGHHQVSSGDIKDHMVYIYGGSSTFSESNAQNTFRTYDLKTHLWTSQTPSGASPRIWYHSSLIYRDQFFIMGGIDYLDNDHPYLYRIDLNTIEMHQVLIPLNPYVEFYSPLMFLSGGKLNIKVTSEETIMLQHDIIRCNSCINNTIFDYKESCNYRECLGRTINDSFICSGHGVCMEYHKCQCQPGYTSYDCLHQECSSNHSIAGDCQNLTCFGVSYENNQICNGELCSSVDSCKCDFLQSAGYACQYDCSFKYSQIVLQKSTKPGDKANFGMVSTYKGLILFGGLDSINSNVESTKTYRYEEFHQEWLEVDSMPLDLQGFFYTSDMSNIVIFGGYQTVSTLTTNTYHYVVYSNVWGLLSAANPPSARAYGDSVNFRKAMVIYSGKNAMDDTNFYQLTQTGYVVVGNSVYAGPRSHYAMWVTNARFFIFGGYNGTHPRYDLITFDANYNTSLHHGYSFPKINAPEVVSIEERNIAYVIGHVDGEDTSTLFEFNCLELTFTKKKKFSFTTQGGRMILHRDYIYIYGGGTFKSTFEPDDLHEQFHSISYSCGCSNELSGNDCNHSKNTTHCKGKLDTFNHLAFTGAATHRFQQKLFTVSGYHPQLQTNPISIVDLNTNTYSMIPNLGKPIYGAYSGQFKESIFLFGGMDLRDNKILSTIIEFNCFTLEWLDFTPYTIPGYDKSPGARYLGASTMFDEFLFIIGGNNGSSVVGGVYGISMKNRIWHRIIDDQFATLQQASISNYRDKLILFGGKSIDGSLKQETAFYFYYHVMFDLIETTGIIPTPRYGHVSIVHRDYMYVIGGNDIAFNDTIYRLDITQSRWDVLGRFYDYKFIESSAVLYQNSIYLLGGSDTRNISLIYHIDGDCSCKSGYFNDTCLAYTCYGYDISSACSGHGQCVESNNCVCDKGYIGRECEYKESTTRCTSTFQRKPDLLFEVESPNYVEFNDSIYILGTSITPPAIVNRYDLELQFNHSVQYESGAPYAALQDSSIVLIGQLVYIQGGFDGSNARNNLTVFDLVNFMWTTHATDYTKDPCYGHSGVAYGDLIYYFGGKDNTVYNDDFHVLSTKRLSIRKLVTSGSSVTVRAYHGSFIYKDDMYVFGGGTGSLSDMFKINLFNYDVTNDLVVRGNDVKGRWKFASFFKNEKFYIYGGEGSGSVIYSDAYSFDPKTNEWKFIVDTGIEIMSAGLVFRQHQMIVFGGMMGSSVLNPSLLEISLDQNCSCLMYHEGSDCSESYCFGYHSSNEDTCSGHGDCVRANLCECHTGWHGPQCQLVQNGSYCYLQQYTYDETPVYSATGAASTEVDNFMYFYGGDGSVDNNLWQYDPTTRVYTIMSNLGVTPTNNWVYSTMAYWERQQSIIIFGGKKEGVGVQGNYYYKFSFYDLQWYTTSFTTHCKLYKHSMTIYKDKLYTFGGLSDTDSFVDDVYSIDLLINDASRLQSSHLVASHTAVHWEKQSKMIIFGGISSTNNVLSRLDSYDYETDSFSSLSSGTNYLYAHNAIIIDDIMYTVGGLDSTHKEVGSTMYRYDLIHEQWLNTFYSGSSYYRYHLQTHRHLNNLLVFGGNHTSYGPIQNIDIINFEICDCKSKRIGDHCEVPTCFGWDPSDNEVCSGHGTCYGEDLCKCDENYHGSTCYYYTPQSNCENIQVSLVSYSPDQSRHEAHEFNGYIYSYGGMTTGGTTIDDMYLYEINDDYWNENQFTGVNFPIPERTSYSSVLYGADIIIYGGTKTHAGDVEIYKDVWAFNAHNRGWKELIFSGDPLLQVYFHGCVLYDNHMYSWAGRIGVLKEVAHLYKLDITKKVAYNITDAMRGPIPPPQHSHGVVAYRDSFFSLLVYNEHLGNILNHTQYNFTTNTWKNIVGSTGDIPAGGNGLNPYVIGDTLYILHHQAMYTYDIEKNHWKQESLISDSSNQRSVVYYDGSLYYLGQAATPKMYIFDLRGNCTCDPGYGKGCDIHLCHSIPSDDPFVCSGHGVCSSIDNCTCFSGHNGTTCDVTECYGLSSTDPNVCSSSGVCHTLDSCSCDALYISSECSIQCQMNFTTDSTFIGNITEGYFYGMARLVNDIYLFGPTGLNGEGILAFHKIDIDTKNITELSLTGNFPSARSGILMTNFGNLLYVYGGLQDEFLFTDMYRYNISSSSWDLLTETSNYRYFSSSEVYMEKYWIMIGGGSIENSKRLDVIDVFDLENEIFIDWGEPTGVKPSGRRAMASILRNKFIYLFGGLIGEGTFLNNIYKLDIDNWELSEIHFKNGPSPRAYVTGFLFGDSKWCLYGGYAYSGGVDFLDKSFMFNFNTETFSNEFFINGSIKHLGAPSTVHENNLYLFGGFTVTTPTKDIFKIQSSCDCPSGLFGQYCNDFLCFGKSKVDPNVCSSHGSCNSINNCECDSNYFGSECSIYSCFDVLSNDSSVCSGHGSCVDYDTCQCLFNDSGLNCELNMCSGISEQDIHVCSGHGDCIGYDSCSCHFGFSGQNCEEYTCNGIASSDSTVCSERGNCTDVDVCVCDSPYYGEFCEEFDCYDYNHQDHYVCTSFGNCLAPDKCKCNPGYSGDDCSTYQCFGVFANSSLVCNGQGSCFDVDVCDCYEGYSGSQCEDYFCNGISHSDPSVCNGHGTCTNQRTCLCNTNYTGEYCESSLCFGIEDKDENVCSGHGVCDDVNTCTCDVNYDGTECDDFTCFGIASNNVNVCSGHGTCSTIDMCQCDSGYTGSQCNEGTCFGKSEYDEDVCNGHGFCLGGNNCDCFSDFYENDCHEFYCFGIISDDSSVCNGHGLCLGPDTCYCDSGFSDDSCSSFGCFGFDSLSSEVCSGHGSCDTVDSCSCDDGYFGEECSEVTCFGHQDESGCSNHGYCEDLDTCVCDSGYTSDNCSIPICFGNTTHPCQNNGICTSPNECQCDGAYEYDDCSLPLCFGESDPNLVCSQGNGKCISPDNCDCNHPYYGTTCDKSSEFFLKLKPTISTIISNVDDYLTSTFTLKTSNFSFFGNKKKNIRISANGYLLFGSGSISGYPTLSSYSGPSAILTFGHTDNDLTGTVGDGSNKIYYRQSSYPPTLEQSEELQKITDLVKKAFISNSDYDHFKATWFMVISSDKVGYFPSKTDKTNSIQVILIVDDSTGKSLVLFNHKLDGIMHPQTHPSIGFADSGGSSHVDVVKVADSTTLLSSKVVQQSNIKRSGYYLFSTSESSIDTDIDYVDQCYGILANNISVCSSSGNCTYKDTCVCQDYHKGEECEIDCSSQQNYIGNTCQFPVCFNQTVLNPSLVCNGHGECVAPNICECNNGYFGNNCKQIKCYDVLNTNSSVCSGHGICRSTDNCVCSPGYSGSNCSDFICFGKNPSSIDACFNGGTCSGPNNCTDCDGPFFGPTCNEAYRYISQSGSDTGNDCLNYNSPCKTLSHAIKVATINNVIYLLNGNYTLNSAIYVKKNITIQSLSGNRDLVYLSSSTSASPLAPHIVVQSSPYIRVTLKDLSFISTKPYILSVERSRFTSITVLNCQFYSIRGLITHTRGSGSISVKDSIFSTVSNSLLNFTSTFPKLTSSVTFTSSHLSNMNSRNPHFVCKNLTSFIATDLVVDNVNNTLFDINTVASTITLRSIIQKDSTHQFININKAKSLSISHVLINNFATNSTFFTVKNVTTVSFYNISTNMIDLGKNNFGAFENINDCKFNFTRFRNVNSIINPGILLSNVSDSLLYNVLITNITTLLEPGLFTNEGSFFILSNSNMKIVNSIFKNGVSCVFITDHSNLIVENSLFNQMNYGVFHFIEMSSSLPIQLSNSNFTNNYYPGVGGVISQIGSFIGTILSNCVFKSNSALQGGSIYISQGNYLLISNSIFDSNICAENISTSTGGAISIDSLNNAFIQNSTFVNNTAFNGGALSFTKVLISKFVIRYGGIYLSNCIFEENTATNGGAILLSTEYIFKVFDSLFKRNHANFEGGAIQSSGTAFSSDLSDEDANVLVSNNSYSEMLQIKKTSGLLIHNTLFENNDATVGGAVSTFSTLISANISSCLFIGNEAINQGGALNALLFSLNIQNTQILNSTSQLGSAIYALTITDQLEIGFFVINSTISHSVGSEGAIYIGENIYSRFVESKFENNTAENGGALFSSSSLSITNCLFNGNKAEKGGSIHVLNTLSMTNSQCLSSKANFGGCIYSSFITHSVSTKQCQFISNSALYGGSIYFDLSSKQSIQQFGVLSFNQSYFKDNSDIAGGSFYFVQSKCVFNTSFSSFNSTSLGYGHLFATNPNTIEIDWIEKFTINAKGETVLTRFDNALDLSLFSGEEFNLNLRLKDSFDNLITIYPSSSLKISLINETSSILFGNNLEIPISSSNILEEMRLSATKGQTVFFKIELKNLGLSYNPLILNATITGCPVGYVAVNDSFCKMCPADSYSLIPDGETCLRSCDNFDCLGGSSLSIHKGYWIDISKEGVATAISCPNGKCFGGNYEIVDIGGSSYPSEFLSKMNSRHARRSITSSASQYVGAYCIGNREGELCAKCLPGYSEWKGNCIECHETSILLTLLYVAFYVALLVFIWLSAQSVTHFAGIKILVSFSQTVFQVINFSNWAIRQSSQALFLAIISLFIDSLFNLSIPSLSQLSNTVTNRDNLNYFNGTTVNFNACPFNRPGYWIHSVQMLQYQMIILVSILCFVISIFFYSFYAFGSHLQSKQKESDEEPEIELTEAEWEENESTTVDVFQLTPTHYIEKYKVTDMDRSFETMKGKKDLLESNQLLFTQVKSNEVAIQESKFKSIFKKVVLALKNSIMPYTFMRCLCQVLLFTYQPLALVSINFLLGCFSPSTDIGYVMISNTDLKCWSNAPEYWYWSLLFFPCLIYIIVFPIAMFIFLRINEKRLYHPTFYKYFGVLYEIYQPKYYWFETIVLLRRFFLVAFTILYNALDLNFGFSGLNYLFYTLVLALNYSLVIILQPFKDRWDNKIEAISLFTIFFMLSAQEGINSVSENVGVIVAVCLTAFMFVFLFFYALRCFSFVRHSVKYIIKRLKHNVKDKKKH